MGTVLDLARVAAEAERLRWRLRARRTVVRAGLAAGGLVFLCAALAMAHVVAMAFLRPLVDPVWAGAIVVGADLVIALVLGVASAQLGAGAAERGAVAVREMAVGEMVRRARVLRLLLVLMAALRR